MLPESVDKCIVACLKSQSVISEFWGDRRFPWYALVNRGFNGQAASNLKELGYGG